MEDMAKTYEFLSNIAQLRQQYLNLKEQSQIPGLISDDRLRIIEDADRVGEKILKSVLEWEPVNTP